MANSNQAAVQATLMQRQKRKRRFRRMLPLIIMMLPMFVITIINNYLPIFGVLLAFKKIDLRKGIFASPWAGLENFKFLFKTDAAWIITRNTVLYNLVFIFGGMILSVAIAIALNEMRSKRASKLYQTLIILPNFLSMVAISYCVYSLLSFNYGYLNNVIFQMMGKEAVDWYTQAQYWPWIIIFTRFWQTAGYGCVIYLATLCGIDPHLKEAAMIDGAGRWQQILHITLPLLKPVMIINLILSLGGIIRGDFGLFYMVPLNSQPLYPVTDVLDTFVYRALITLQDMGKASAAGFYQSVIGCIMVVAANAVVRKIDSDQALF